MVNLRARPKLTNEERNSLAQWLLQHSTQGKLHHGAKKQAAEKFHVALRTVWTVWKSANSQQALGLPIQLNKMKKGLAHKDKWKIDIEKVKKLSVLERSSLRVMAGKLGVSKSLVHKWVKEKQLKPHTNAIKPFLTAENKICRLKWSLNQLSAVNEGGFIKFQSMFNTIHIDEKWFYLTKSKDRYYLLPGENEPYRSCKSKRFIEKIMFICAVARPIIDAQGNIIFDGKLGIFPFITEEAAKRNSKNRIKGTMEVKPIPNITKNVMRDCMITQMVPHFKTKWPEFASKDIFIQQDNAKPHIKPDDPEFVAVARQDGFNFQLVCQPANSPDTNVNDLGFFRAIQTLKDQKPAKNVEELLKNVQDAYEEYPPEKLNHVFLTLQSCYQEIIKDKGGNNYKIPHMNKERLSRLQILPDVLAVEEQLVHDTIQFINMQGTQEQRQHSIDQLELRLQQVVIS
ncbi:uncharacterized protein LOC131009281 [Salvia miltiorrhiza]|uniref:uncharacterized protein LOC131009281 n=1 Tax=Salvia miltiorrhiza TaxID=226208 RepID=UPI0025AC7228|nr:uncharacterized protein LOC131009281 [Salvia miltiorrhiza]